MKSIICVLLSLFAVFTGAHNNFYDYDEWGAGQIKENPLNIISDKILDPTPDILGPCAPSGSALPCSPNASETYNQLQRIVNNSGGRITLHSAGTTVQNRTIWYVRAGNATGTANAKYLVWGRTHGNECVGTAGILGALAKLIDGSLDSNRILEKSLIVAIPIFNVDGSELGTRFTAPFPGWPNGRDLNRDWCMRNQTDQESPCVGQTVADPITGLPIGGCPNAVCACPPEATSFITKELNALWDLYLSESFMKPFDVVLDIHQFGNALYPEVNRLVAAQAVVPRYPQTFSRQIVHRNEQLAQVIYDTIFDNDMYATRWNLSSTPGLPDRSSAGRISETGKRDVHDPVGFPTVGMGLEMRRVCPVYESVLEDLTTLILMDQFRSLANGVMFRINPTSGIYVPFAESFSCNTPCPTSIRPQDLELIEKFKEDQQLNYDTWEFMAMAEEM